MRLELTFDHLRYLHVLHVALLRFSFSTLLQMLFILLLLCIHVHYWNLETLSSLFQASLSCCYPNPILSSSHPSFLSQSPFVLCECKVGHLVSHPKNASQQPLPPCQQNGFHEYVSLYSHCCYWLLPFLSSSFFCLTDSSMITHGEGRDDFL